MINTLNILHIAEPIPYEDALTLQEDILRKVISGTLPDTLIFCEHPAVYTCGSSADVSTDYIGGNDIPLIKTGRGGKITYHGPGQIIAYPIINLENHGKDLRKYVQNLQSWLIDSLADVGISAHTSDDVGVWVADKTTSAENKIAAIGVRVRKWVTFHGIALNHNVDLAAYSGIVPCGIRGKGVTSVAECGVQISRSTLTSTLEYHFREKFNALDAKKTRNNGR